MFDFFQPTSDLFLMSVHNSTLNPCYLSIEQWLIVGWQDEGIYFFIFFCIYFSKAAG